MKKGLKIFFTIISIASSLFIFSCKSVSEKNSDIVILYENDVHCFVDGYAKLAGLKEDLKNEYNYVGVVSSGDFVQGGSLGSISKGKYIVDLMNLVGYDAIALGNHEFDYKIPRLMELVELLDRKPICSNFKKLDSEDFFFKPYNIINYGKIDIAYIGITTPSTLGNSLPAQFKNENDEYIYTFSGDDLYSTVQKAIDSAISEGAEYVIALAHLGTEDVEENWSSLELIKNTSGIDVLLDGHSHSIIEEQIVENENGEDVILSSTGSEFENIGKLIISSDGRISTKLIPTENISSVNEKVLEKINEIKNDYEELGNKKIGVSNVDLITHNSEGKRIIRTEETNLGDLCADAYRLVTKADIGLVNGGGIRNNIPKGEITFNTILSVYPFNNTVCVGEDKGQDILDFLELAVKDYPEENGSFQHVSGITFEVDYSIESSVVVDQNENFIEVSGNRRVSNVKVLNKETGIYEDLDLNKVYSIASHNYLLLEDGSGATMFDDIKITQNTGMLDYELLERYIKDNLSGIVGEEYKNSQNRIIVKNE